MDRLELWELEKLVESGDPESMYKLAKIYRKGKTYNAVFIPMDRKKSIELLQAASAKGHKASTFLLKHFETQNRFIELIDDVIDAIKTFAHRLKESIASIIYIVFWVLLSVAVIVLVVKGISNLPISLAIIIGAIIIALAVKK
jgi:flagellar biosynthesis regulator FlaF